MKAPGFSPPQLAIMLSKTGVFVVTEAMIRDDIQAGAPTNADGTINPIRYAAWLVKQDLNGSES